ncbi:PadR family transcriptional regulator [Alicyclobacillus hesperidum]|uniref:DNA-binding transcriptional regulator, PadR family n=1 Tax=Alicyclobacillus hesperidum TaxID=89784 RepID=A0A1H2Y5Q6_9BACL|nr:helix-turn-helix transcriptional regulator [Alicyclobacillus hesperidum]GLV14933.1 PadR family transcriptional regulator [Alicyclobacillus hesperidum]SDW99994.1 DNA-binding transcriptional regulator, PadR family [Alicyclobacillus hesperidum]
MAKERGLPGKQNRHLPAFLLLFLAKEDAHGGALWNRMSEIMPADCGVVDSGAVYRVLRELEERECVTSVWNTEEAGPAKRIYHITSKGFFELNMWYNDICLRKKNLDFFIEQYESMNRPEDSIEETDK